MGNQNELLVSAEDMINGISSSTNKVTTITIKKKKISIVEMEDVLFNHNSAVLLPSRPAGPDAADGGGSTDEQNKITGLEVIKVIYRYCKLYPDKKLIIAGHTDASEPTKYNFSLSALRGEAVRAVLKNDKTAWTATVKDKHKVADYKQIFNYFHTKYLWPCGPLSVDDTVDDATKEAITKFQEKCKKIFNPDLEITGRVDEATWEVILDAYMADLTNLMNEKSSPDLQKWRDAVHFYDTNKMVVACGESIPIATPGLDGRSQSDRRVDIVFVGPEDEDLKLTCPSTVTEKHKREDCPLYNTNLVTPEYIKLEDIVKPVTDKLKIAIDSIEATTFVPKAEEIEIKYSITGPIDFANKVVMEVTTAKDTVKKLLEKQIASPPAATGSFKWDGAVTDNGYKGYINLLHSPYKITLRVDSTVGTSAFSETKEVMLEVKKIEIEVDDPPPLIIPDFHKGAITALKNDLKKNKDKGNIWLYSPVFKEDGEMDGNASFIQYRLHWGNGVLLPLFARIFLAAKDGSEKQSTEALYETKVLWDSELDDINKLGAELDARSPHDKAKTFIKKVAAYEKDSSDPKGCSTHTHFGGMRNASASKTGSEKYWRQMFSTWALTEPSSRKWAGHTICGVNADIAMQTGVYIIVGRMAGDRHTVRAYVDRDGTLDSTDDGKLTSAPAAVKSNSFTFTIWRDMPVVGMYKSGEKTEELDLTKLTKEYHKAHMHIALKSGTTVKEIRNEWHEEYKKVVADLAKKSNFIKHAALDDPGLHPVKYRDYIDYWKSMNKDAGFWSTLWERISAFFGAKDVETYRKECDNKAYSIYMRVVQKFPLPSNGLTFFKFGEDGDHNQWSGSFTAGMAPHMDGYSDRNRAFMFVFKKGKAADTMNHEVGHLLFLAHAPGHYEKGKQPPGYQPNAHDENQICLMSYHEKAETLCGQCILKLRGWDYTKINKDGSIV